MKRLLYVLAGIMVIAALGGCKQVQLGGVVVGADVDIDLLNQPGGSYQFARTTSSTDGLDVLGLEKWSDLTDLQKTFWLGAFDVDEALVDPGRLYLVTASGGADTDVDRDRELDRQNTPVKGTWHAIAPGSALLPCCNQVSALTEAAYQSVRDRIGYVSDEELQDLLDDFAVLVVKDLNGDEQVDYADVLLWSRLLFASKYRGDINLLDNLADVITRGAPDYVVRAAAESVVRNVPVQPLPPEPAVGTELGGSITGDIVLTEAMSPYIIRTRLNVEGDLRVEPGVTITGGGILAVSGNLLIEGLPRQRVVIENLSITLYSYGSGVTSVVRNADIIASSMDFGIQRLLVDGNRLNTVNIRVSNIVKSEDSRVDILQNVIAVSTIEFLNSGPTKREFKASLENNFFETDIERLSTVLSRWDGPQENFTIRNNTFNVNMRFLRGTSGAKMDISSNYWGNMAFPADQIDEIIPDNEGTGLFGAPVIPYLPYLEVSPQGTPAPW